MNLFIITTKLKVNDLIGTINILDKAQRHDLTPHAYLCLEIVFYL